LYVPKKVSGAAVTTGNPMAAVNAYDDLACTKIRVFIPGARSWELEHFLMTLSHSDAMLNPKFVANVNGRADVVFKAILPLVPGGSSSQGFFGFGSEYAVPIAIAWSN